MLLTGYAKQNSVDTIHPNYSRLTVRLPWSCCTRKGRNVGLETHTTSSHSATPVFKTKKEIQLDIVLFIHCKSSLFLRMPHVMPTVNTSIRC